MGAAANVKQIVLQETFVGFPNKTVMVNGESIFEDGHETGAVPGRLLRHGG